MSMGQAAISGNLSGNKAGLRKEIYIMEEIKISVIVPIYNVSARLGQCLDSLIHQTCREIEILCAEDASTDGSRELLLSYAEKDSRIIPLLHEENQGTSMMRKEAVLASRGKYVMFVDGDDFLDESACERAYQAIEKSAVDILQYGAEIENCAGVAQSRIEINQRLVKPFLERLEDVDLVRFVWKEKKFRFTLWNKIYNGDICRRAFEKIEDGYFPKGQDLYAFFLIAYFSHSTEGITDVLYHYNFGIGITGSDQISLDTFEVLLQEQRVYAAIERFIEEEGKTEEYRDVLSEIRNGFVGECVNKYLNNLRGEYLSAGFHLLTETWGFEDVLCMFAEKYWTNRAVVAKKMAEVDVFGGDCGLSADSGPTVNLNISAGSGTFAGSNIHTSKKKTTIAAYYRSIKNGGAQRVVAELCNIWQGLKDSDGDPLYRVILITDEKEQEDEYALDKNITRCFLPAYDVYTKSAYRERYHAWNRILLEQDIDMIVDSMWIAPCTLFDLLCIKYSKKRPAFFLHTHFFSAVPYQYEGNNALAQIYIYQMCDGVVALSECDRDYISTFCRNVKCIANPVTVENPVSEEEKDGKTIVWVGRLSSEKRPLDAVYAMEYVVREEPDAVLYMVGDGDDAIRNQMAELIGKLNLEKHVILTGFQTDVTPYYQRATVFIGTSEYEGFSLTICEALSYAVPVVSYDLPWLTVMRDGRGIIPVKQGRPDLLAQEVIKLLRGPETCAKLGAEGQKQMAEMEETDTGGEWQAFFDDFATAGKRKDEIPAEMSSTQGILYRYLTIFQQDGKNKIESSKQRIMGEKTEISRQLKRTVREKEKLNERHRQVCQEKSELGAELRQTAKEAEKQKRENERLKEERGKLKEEREELKKEKEKLKKEKEKLDARLQQTYSEKSELNAKLQQTYREKSERGAEIKRLQSSWDYRIGHKLLWLPRKVKGFFAR